MPRSIGGSVRQQLQLGQLSSPKDADDSKPRPCEAVAFLRPGVEQELYDAHTHSGVIRSGGKALKEEILPIIAIRVMKGSTSDPLRHCPGPSAFPSDEAEESGSACSGVAAAAAAAAASAAASSSAVPLLGVHALWQLLLGGAIGGRPHP